MDPVELVDLRRGDPQTWRLVHQWVRRAAVPYRAVLAEGWEDAVQEAEIRLLRAFRAGRFEQGTKLGSYTRTVTRNVCIDELRRRRLRATEALDEARGPPADPLGSPPATAERAEHGLQLRRVLAVLSDECRQLLYALSRGRSYSQLAEQLGVRPGTLRVRAHRCRKTAARRLERMRSPAIGAAERLYLERGLPYVTLQGVARSGGLSREALDRLFPDTTALFWAVVHRMVTGVQGFTPQERDIAEPIRASPDPGERIRQATRVTAAMYARGLADMHAVVHRAVREDPRHAPLLRDLKAAQAGVGLRIGRAVLAGAAPRRRDRLEALCADAAELVGPENYLPRTRRRGWTESEFWAWAREGVQRMLFRA